VDAVIATPALPIVAELLAPHVQADYLARLRRIRYLANLCLVLELDRSLSATYWLNVNDPGFPFVGVIEHTNFEPAGSYGGRHIVYLSKYLPEDVTQAPPGPQAREPSPWAVFPRSACKWGNWRRYLSNFLRSSS
jgi:protoporphyrinogen oxidase